MQLRRGDLHLLSVLLKIYQTFSTTNNKMISPNRKAYLFIIEEICNKDTQNIGIDIIGYGNYHLAHYDRENDSTNVLEIMFPTGITQSKYCRTVC